jgi:UDP-glucuronate 4-epimerase
VIDGTVLVTGAAGFIGSHLVELLLEETNCRLVCLDDFNPSYDVARKRANVAGFVAHPRVRLIEHSFCDAAFMQRLVTEEAIRYVAHLGGHAGVRASLADPWRYEQVNVGGTLALLEAVRGRPLERFLLASSSTVYGWGAPVPFLEDGPLGVPLSPYGVSKRAAELLCLMYWRVHGVPAVCTRLFSVYGPRLRPDLALAVFTRAIDRGQPIPLYGDGSVQRDFTHVSDVCRGLLAALACEGAVGEAVNLGHAEPIAIREVIELVAQALGKAAQIELRPGSPADLPATCADLSKAQRLLNYRPQIGFAEGVRAYVDWYRDTAT